jgi:membrane protease YdiL (CAAX protease family)
MIWFIRQRLLKPRGISLRQAFGLSLCDTGWGQLVKVSLGFLAIEWLGTVLIGWLGWRLGVGSHWSDGVQERMIFGPSETVWLAAVNFILWAAIFEEIGFRGLLYTTLRKRLNMKLAIILSALIFSAMHLYSLAGFLSVFWSGMVLAYVYERYHSLLPGMIIHGASNLLSLSTVLLFYR